MDDGDPPAIERLLEPFRDFARSAAAGGILLMIAAVIALIWANSPFGASYLALLETPVTVAVGDHAVSMTLVHWINDGLMAIFFLLVGLEIKREVLVGELASRRRAALPLAAAIGGAILPAVLFLLIVGSGPGARGWGIPMATDIAFALGVLALLGSRAPVALKIFLTALAIVDDLLAVAVIAVFYTADLDIAALAMAGVTLAALVAANRLGVRTPVVYAVLGVVLWLVVLRTGIHATVAGVLLALTIPSTIKLDAASFEERARSLIDRFSRAASSGPAETPQEGRNDALWDLSAATEMAQAPMLRMEHTLTPWVAFIIVPVFALANAGVVISGDVLTFPPDALLVGVLVGLVVGKVVGVSLGTWLVVRAGLASLPSGVTWRHVFGVSWLAGIGFTMSLFIADLGLGQGPTLATAKVGILVASVVAGTSGYLVLRSAAKSVKRAVLAPADETA